MRYFIFTLFPIIQDIILVIIIVKGLLILRARRSRTQSGFVSMPSILFWVGTAAGFLFSIPITFVNIDKLSISTWLIFEAFILIGVVMILAYCNEIIVYDNSRFEVSNLFGHKQLYYYGDITEIEKRGRDSVLYCGKRKILLDEIALGTQEFIKSANKAYCNQNGRSIPKRNACKRAKDPFRGNIQTPWLFFVIYMFIVVASICMIVLPIYAIRPADDSIPKDATEFHTSFTTYERIRKDSGTLLLYSPSYEKPFSLSWLSGYEVSVPDPDEMCNGDLYIITAREGTYEFFVYAISTGNNTPIVRAIDQNTAYRNTQFVPCVCLIIMGVLFLITSALGIIVGRNPSHFSRRVRRLFFKDYIWNNNTNNHIHRK